MSGFFQDLLSGAQEGFFENPYLRDFTHASKTFRTNAYGYSPKFKFLFHVYFDINEQNIQAAKNWPEDKNFGLAVKTVQLPKYTFDLATLNQYNRKRIVQTKLKYDPINITFHDDNSNLIRRLWYTYYSYYFKDPSQQDLATTNNPAAGDGKVKQSLNRRNIYDNDISGSNDWGYIGETDIPQTNLSVVTGSSKAPFFKAINIYGFNQHNYVLYRLINPTIESFSHDTYDYSQTNGIMEHQMTLQYETVKYYEGAVDGRVPYNQVKGFGTAEHYDTLLSPISRPGSNATIMGPGGLVNAVGGILNDLDSDNPNILGAIQKAGVAYNTFKNPQNILKIAKNELINEANNYLKGTPNRNTVFNFPTASQVAQTANSTLNSAYKNTVGKIV